MSEQLYKKVGKKYIPIGYSDGFTGFPTEGIWVVYKKQSVKSEQCIANVGEFKQIDYSILSTLIKDKHDKIMNIVSQKDKSFNDITNEILIEITTIKNIKT